MEGLQVDFEQITSWMLFKNANDFEMYLKRLEAIAPRVSDGHQIHLNIQIYNVTFFCSFFPAMS